jgi:hypothetical protein
MTYDPSGPIDPTRDREESFASVKPSRLILERLVTDDDFKRRPGAIPGDVYLPGAKPGTEFFSGQEGIAVQLFKAPDTTWLLMDVNPITHRWTGAAGDETSDKPPGIKYDKKRQGLYTPEGYGVKQKTYVPFLRRGDATVYTLLLEGPETKLYKRWEQDALNLFNKKAQPMPFYGARWRLFLEKIEDDQERTFINWQYKLLACWGDSSPDAISDAEYVYGRDLAHGRPQARSGGNGNGNDNGAKHDGGDTEPPAPPPGLPDNYDADDWAR